MAKRFHFTKVAIEMLPTPTILTYYRDTKSQYLGLYITKQGIKTFFAVLTMNGKTRRIAIGQHPALSVPRARSKAIKVATDYIENGVDPTVQRRARKAARITLREVIAAYLEERDLKTSTMADYTRAIDELCADWLDRPLAAIKPEQVLRRYLQRGEKSKARTDNGLRVLRAVFNFARARYKRPDGSPLLLHNPTDIIGETRTRFKPTRRQRIIAANDLPSWWRAVNGLDNHAERDWLLFMLLTGCRSTESATLRWENVNLHAQTFTLINTKNRRVVTLPLPDTIVVLLRQRRPTSASVWVFPSKADDSKHLNDPREVIKRLRRETCIVFSPHDLRRTFATIAESLDMSTHVIKLLLNHTTPLSDVTAGYILADTQRLRDASERIERQILTLAGERAASIVPLRR